MQNLLLFMAAIAGVFLTKLFLGLALIYFAAAGLIRIYKNNKKK